MKLKALLKLGFFGATTVIFKRKKPIIASIILTDKCNLSCRHCAVSNVEGVLYPHDEIIEEMNSLYREGVRILFLYGGEPFLWQDGGIGLRELVLEAKDIGFEFVNVVTNGTFNLNLPEADLLMVSLDGTKENHDTIRGDTYDKIISNIQMAPTNNICLYMAINQINKDDIEYVCKLTESHKNIKAVSFNFHTPYPGTEYLKLSIENKEKCAKEIIRMIEAGYPILNLKSALPYIVKNTFKTPCYQCQVVENGKRWICGRCLAIEGLCEECGFFFAAEYSLAFSGKIKVLFDLVKTYGKYV